MRRILVSVVAGALTLGTAIPSFAAGRIDRRKDKQQARIAQGVKNGSLTPRETGRLEHQESAINREVRHDRKVNGGTLTPAQKARVNHQQNVVSRHIYRQKHDAQTQK
jgi:hypothetical protein